MSSGDTSFVIKDQMAWSPSENGTGTNGHGFVPNLPKTGPTQNSSPTVEEEDPYEKIEIRKAEMPLPVQPSAPAVETVVENVTKTEKSHLTVKNEIRNKSEDPSDKSWSDEGYDEQSEVETGIKIVCQISEVENKMQFKVEEKIISMKPEEVREREIIAKAEEVNKNCCGDISSDQNPFDVSSERKSKESEDKGQVASHIETEKQVHILGGLFLQFNK